MEVYYSILLWIVTLYPQSSSQSEGKCNSALGMKNRGIPDESITASSQLDSNHTAFLGRLHGSKAWCSAKDDEDPYIEIKLDEEHSITALSTQGSPTDGVWSSKYRIDYHTGGKWTQYQKELPGNRNLQSEQRNNLDPEILTKSIRIFPKDPFSILIPDVKYKCLRVELYGCLPPADCRDPGRPINGERKGHDFNNGSRVSFSCKQGFLLIGNSSSVCNMGKWNNALPQCKATCEDPGIPENGNRKGIGNFMDGDTIEFSCSRNYSLFGSSISRCLKGRWSSALPQCKAVCRDPGIPRNGKRIGNDFREGQLVAFLCDGNFTLVGPSLVFCVAGQWEATTPTCKASCSNPGSPEHGYRIGSDFGHGGQVTFLCLPKYSLLGSSTMTCHDGKWSSVLPVCKAYCENPGSPHNGVMHGNNFHHTKRISFSCLPGFKLIGHFTAVCINGKWSAPVPRCKVVCPDPGAPTNGRRVGDSFVDGQTVAFRCHEGHTLIGQQVLRCLSGRWSSDVPECKAKSCGDPGSPENGKKNSLVYTFKSKVYFECSYGYELVGDKYRQCQSNQKWSGQKPTCEPIDCGQLPTPEKAQKVVETSTRINGRVIFECKEKGYEIRGSETRSCQENGTWSGVATSCEIISCGDPGVPIYGRQVHVSNNYKYGSFIEFDCNENYTFSGDRKIVCGETKDWSAPLPRCFAPCSDPGVPRNGARLSNRFLSEDSVSFECHKGFELKGNKSITCVDGVWKGAKPRCEVILCKDPGTPQNGSKKKSSRYTYGGVVRFKCDTNYTLSGEKRIRCQENKKWTGSIPKCQAPCSHPGQPKHGRIFGVNLKHNSILKIECKTGYVANGSTAIRCTDGKWNTTVPTCNCGGGNPLRMGNGFIPDEAITSSSETRQNPAHLGRLGEELYWCSGVESESHLEISLSKKQRITSAIVDVVRGQQKAEGVALLAKNGDIWYKLSVEKVKSSGKVKLTSRTKMDTDKVRIFIHRQRKEESRVCLRAEIYGCDAE